MKNKNILQIALATLFVVALLGSILLAYYKFVVIKDFQIVAEETTTDEAGE